MAVYKNTPPVVTDGLVMYLDAANRNSYVAPSFSWVNLAPGNSASLETETGGVSHRAFLAADSISLQFSGSNDGAESAYTGSYAILPQYPEINLAGSSSFSIVSAFYFRNYPTQRSYVDSGNTVALCVKNSYSPSYGLNILFTLPVPSTSGSFTLARVYAGIRNISGTAGTTIGYGIDLFNSPTPLLPNTWYVITHTHKWNSTLTRHEQKIYINGILDYTSLYTPPAVSGSSYPVNFYNTGPMNIASRDVSGGNGIYANINIGVNMVYNKELTPNEVIQNYNALKTRLKLT